MITLLRAVPSTISVNAIGNFLALSRIYLSTPERRVALERGLFPKTRAEGSDARTTNVRQLAAAKPGKGAKKAVVIGISVAWR